MQHLAAIELHPHSVTAASFSTAVPAIPLNLVASRMCQCSTSLPLNYTRTSENLAGQTPYLWRAKILTVESREPSGSINSILPSHHGDGRLCASVARICFLREANRPNESLQPCCQPNPGLAPPPPNLGMVEGVGFEPT